MKSQKITLGRLTLVVLCFLPENENRAGFRNIVFLLKITCWPKSIKRFCQLTLVVLFSLP